MRRKLPGLLAGILLSVCVSAQYATIPDSTFVTWLQNNGFAACMIGNQIDTNCTYVLAAHSIKCYAQPVHDITGIQYFKNLDSLDCSNDSLSSLPPLPGQLSFLNCNYNKLTSLPNLPGSLNSLWCIQNKLDSLPALKNVSDLECSNNQLSSIPMLSDGITKLICLHNQLESLPALPTSLQMLQCDYNSHLSSLPALPANLQMLHCSNDSMTTIPALPATLINFDCRSNKLINLPTLPVGLLFLWCGNNLLNSLPELPSTLQQLDCTTGSLSSLPALPSSLYDLYCGRNSLDSLPALPGGLQKLYCDHNQITHFPQLPAGLTIIYCSNNNLTSLPAIPASVSNLLCDHNSLSSLPELPDSLNVLQCNYNTNLYCLPQLKKINTFYFDNTNISCLPDYGSVLNSYPNLNTLPLCSENSNSSCSSFWNITGKVYFDANNNCVMDAGDSVQANVKVLLYDSNSLVAQVYTGGDGYYSFRMATHGTYYVVVDTSVIPFRVSCPSNGSRTVVISNSDSMAYSQDFALGCRDMGFDLGISSIINGHNTPQPGTVIPVHVIAGSLSQIHGANCNSGIGGVVQLIISGPAKYDGLLPSGLTPSGTSGDTVTWNISDFGQINNNLAFGLNIMIDTLAQAGTQICVTANIIPGMPGDYNLSNNSLEYCFSVVNSLDPNTKEVYPVGDTITCQDWLTYTVRFQNTGSAIAQNIVILDTLDSHLNAATLQVLSASDKYTVTQLGGGVTRFSFQSVNLPDSIIDQAGSHGYIQYKVLPVQGLAPGTYIQNTAYIYFDYNAPIATNTTTNRIALATQTTGVSNIVSGVTELGLYPNPASKAVTVKVDNTCIGGTLVIMNSTGQEVAGWDVRNPEFTLPLNSLANGIYFVKVTNSKGHFNMKKLVVQK